MEIKLHKIIKIIEVIMLDTIIDFNTRSHLLIIICNIVETCQKDENGENMFIDNNQFIFDLKEKLQKTTSHSLQKIADALV